MGKEDREIPSQYPDWENARLPKPFFGSGSRYLISLTSANDPRKIVYAIMSTPDPTDRYDTIAVDIPTEDYTSKDSLVDEAYATSTTWGELDERYLKFATDYGNLGPILALLNREASDTRPQDTAEWFYKTFGVEHAETYKSVHVSSHGSDRSFNITLEPVYRRQQTTQQGSSIQQAAQFTESIQQAVPHVRVTPVSMDAYLDAVYSSLQFLPRDWHSKK